MDFPNKNNDTIVIIVYIAPMPVKADPVKLLQKSKDLAWSVDAMDWEAPGRPGEEIRSLHSLMADLAWIEHIAHPAFSALAASVQDPVMKELYGYFQEEEDRHAQAEVMLMRRWGLHRGSGMPKGSSSVMTLQKSAEKVVWMLHPSVLVAVIPMLELVLDGGLVKSLTSRVNDPVFHEVFHHINADEARHLLIDFHALENYGRQAGSLSAAQIWMERLRSFTNAEIMKALFFGFMPYLAHARHSFDAAGLEWTMIQNSLEKYVSLGKDNEFIAATPAYQVISLYAEKLSRGDLIIEDFMLRLSDLMAGFSLN